MDTDKPTPHSVKRKKDPGRKRTRDSQGTNDSPGKNDAPGKKKINYHRVGKRDDLSTTIKKLEGNRDAKGRWGYRRNEQILNGGLVALHHLNALGNLLSRNLEQIAQLKKERERNGLTS